MSAQTVSKKFDRQNIYAQGNGINAYGPTSSMNWGPKIADLANDATYGGNTDNKYTQAYGKHEGMYYNPKYAAAGLDGWATPQIYDNVGDFFDTGFTQNSNLSISQKNGNLAYSFGIGDTYQTGIVPSTGMMRTTARGAVDFEINKQWKTGFSANYSSTKITSAPGANSGIMNVVYSAPSEYNLKGTPTHVPNDPTSQILFRSTQFNNPYWWKDNNEFSQRTNRVFGNAYLEYRPNFGWDTERYNLVIREQAGLDIYTTNNSDVYERVLHRMKVVRLKTMVFSTISSTTSSQPTSQLSWVPTMRGTSVHCSVLSSTTTISVTGIMMEPISFSMVSLL